MVEATCWGLYDGSDYVDVHKVIGGTGKARHNYLSYIVYVQWTPPRGTVSVGSRHKNEFA